MSVGGIARASKLRPVPLRLPPIPSIRDILKIYKLNALKQLSQNFLLDEKIINKIVNAAGSVHGCHVCEVGPGPGGITRSILAKGASKVYLIEKDRRFERSLRMLEEVFPGQFVVRWGDVLSYNLSKEFPEELRRSWTDYAPPIHIIGNLPFSISTPLIIKYLEEMSTGSSAWAFGRVPCTLTFQKEVAERMTAPIIHHQRSRLSIMCQYLCEVFYKFTISGNAFVPKPDVDVAVVKFIPRRQPLINHPFKLVEKVVRHAFCMRQKGIRKPISTLFPKPIRQEITDRLFYMTRLDSTTKPVQLEIDDFGIICDAYAKLCEEFPGLSEYNYRLTDPDTEWLAVFGDYEPTKSLIAALKAKKEYDSRGTSVSQGLLGGPTGADIEEDGDFEEELVKKMLEDGKD